MNTGDRTLRAAQGKAAVGRADLLWMLQTLAQSEWAEAAALLGFEEKREAEAGIVSASPTDESKQVTNAQPADTSARRPPLRATHFAVLSHVSFPDESSDDLEVESNGVVLDYVGAEVASPPPFLYLSSRRRMAVFLRSQLRERRSISAVDLGPLIHHMMRASLPERLPRQQRLCWTSDVALVIDFSLVCLPLRADLIELAETAHVVSGGRLRVLWFDAQGCLQRQPGRRAEWKPVAERVLRAARHWLLAGSLGVTGPDTSRFGRWSSRIGRHIDRGGEVTFLTGGFAPEARNALPSCTRATGWERGRRFKLTSVRRLPYGFDQGDVERLLAALCMAVVIEPALLRAIRLVLGLSTAVELAVWNHPDAEPCLIGMQVRRDRLVEYRGLLRRWPLETRQQVASLVEAHHVAHSRLIRFEEAALAADLASWNVDAVRTQWAAVLDTLKQTPEGEAARELRGYLHRAGLRAHSELWRTVPTMEHAYVLARRQALIAGSEVPAGVSATTLNRYLAGDDDGGPKREVRPLWFVQTGPYLAVCSRPPIEGQFRLLESPPVSGFELETPAGIRHWWRLPQNTRVVGELLSGEGPWTIRTPFAESVIAEIPRPSWAIEWGRDAAGLYACAPSPLGGAVRLYWDSPTSMLFHLYLAGGRGFSAETVPLAPGIRMWADLKFGLVLDVQLGNALQRFRWIEPGEFVMGSPEGEEGRADDEGPQHVVRLTEGFWLAETACSQAVWESVIGSNPSKFKHDLRNPVEQVSWDDVQVFLREVEKSVPGVKADLPTEAEWEYACRAGGGAAFSWGNSIKPSQANYYATEGYANGPTGEYWEGTVPVKSFEPNSWGLYQMHGNVWEWCADGVRQYGSVPQTDPLAPVGDDPDERRAARGAAWLDRPRLLRAACRSQGPRSLPRSDQGFRFSLRPQPMGRSHAVLTLTSPYVLHAEGGPVPNSVETSSRSVKAVRKKK